MLCVVCRETRAACSHKICVFPANFDGGFAYNGEHAAGQGKIPMQSIHKYCMFFYIHNFLQIPHLPLVHQVLGPGQKRELLDVLIREGRLPGSNYAPRFGGSSF